MSQKKKSTRKRSNAKAVSKNTAPEPGRTPAGTFDEGNQFSLKYKDEYADRLLKFFNQPLSRVEFKKYTKGSCETEIPVEMTNDFPTMGMFARTIGVGTSALKAWAGVTYDGRFKHDRFARAYTQALEWAEGMMESGALSGKLDTNMAKFVLTNSYGKQDKQVVETTVKGVDEKDLELIRKVQERLTKEHDKKE